VSLYDDRLGVIVLVERVSNWGLATTSHRIVTSCALEIFLLTYLLTYLHQSLAHYSASRYQTHVRVVLPARSLQPLANLLTGTATRCQHFPRDIRKYLAVIGQSAGQ